MRSSAAIIIAGALISAAILFGFRWEMATFGGETYRLDRWTGEIVGCNATNQKRLAASELGVGYAYRCRNITQPEIQNGRVEP